MAIPYPNIPAETAETAGQYRAKIDANFEAINNFDTDNIPEGSNEYFTSARAQDVVKAMVVNDLETGGADAPLSAEQGKTLNASITEHENNNYIHVTADNKTAWNEKQNALTFDTTPTSGSTNPVTSSGIKTALGLKTDKTTTVNGHALSSNVVVSASDVGLGNVNNTSDANKPVSTAQQSALDAKVSTSSIVNDLTAGGTTVPLSAEQGRTLNTNKAEKTKMFYPDNQYGGIISSNFDAISVSGSYTGFGTATGAPTTAQSWFIRHINSNSGTTTAYQEAIGYTDGAFYTRRKVSGVWNNWVLKTKMLDNRDWTTHDILFSVTTDGFPALTIS